MTLINNNTYVTVFVIAFAAFIVTGLAIVPAFVQDADAERKKPKKPKKNDFSIEEPVIELVKNTKDKKPKKHDFSIEEPIVKVI